MQMLLIVYALHCCRYVKSQLVVMSFPQLIGADGYLFCPIQKTRRAHEFRPTLILSDDRTHNRNACRLLQDWGEHIAPLCTKRHSNTDLMHAPGHAMRGGADQTDCSQNKHQQGPSVLTSTTPR